MRRKKLASFCGELIGTARNITLLAVEMKTQAPKKIHKLN